MQDSGEAPRQGHAYVEKMLTATGVQHVLDP